MYEQIEKSNFSNLPFTSRTKTHHVIIAVKEKRK